MCLQDVIPITAPGQAEPVASAAGHAAKSRPAGGSRARPGIRRKPGPLQQFCGDGKVQLPAGHSLIPFELCRAPEIGLRLLGHSFQDVDRSPPGQGQPVGRLPLDPAVQVPAGRRQLPSFSRVGGDPSASIETEKAATVFASGEKALPFKLDARPGLDTAGRTASRAEEVAREARMRADYSGRNRTRTAWTRREWGNWPWSFQKARISRNGMGDKQWASPVLQDRCVLRSHRPRGVGPTHA